MNKKQIKEIVLAATNDFLRSERPEVVAMEDFLFSGPGGRLDSVGLVNVVVNIENKFLDLGMGVTIASEKAFFSEASPFRNVSSLTDFIYHELHREEIERLREA